MLVQTFNPENPTIDAALGHDFERFAALEIPQREQFGYPPFRQLARIVIRGESEKQVEAFARQIGDRLEEHIEKDQLDVTVLGPAAAPITKLRGKYRFHLFLNSLHGSLLRSVIKQMTDQIKTPDDMQWIVDIDPLDML